METQGCDLLLAFLSPKERKLLSQVLVDSICRLFFQREPRSNSLGLDILRDYPED